MSQWLLNLLAHCVYLICMAAATTHATWSDHLELQEKARKKNLLIKRKSLPINLSENNDHSCSAKYLTTCYDPLQQYSSDSEWLFQRYSTALSVFIIFYLSLAGVILHFRGKWRKTRGFSSLKRFWNRTIQIHSLCRPRTASAEKQSKTVILPNWVFQHWTQNYNVVQQINN